MAWIAASEGDGARVRDAATDLESRCEEVERRDPRRESNPVAWHKPEASDPTRVQEFEAIHAAPATSTAACKLTKSLARCCASDSGRTTRTAGGAGMPWVSRRATWAGTHGDADLEQQRGPDDM